MDLQIDLRVAELLASRLCHDLVGPIGAVSNGMELLADGGMDMADDALDLTRNSAEQASGLLQFYRMAYGMAGNRQGGDLKPLRDVAAQYFSRQKVSLDWPSGPAPQGMSDLAGKLILNMLVMAAEALPRGGTVGVLLSNEGAGNDVTVVAVGADAALRDETRAGLADAVDVEELTPRSVHAYFTRLLTRRLGTDLKVEPAGSGHLRFGVSLPVEG
jgi:histidine phosphotransferase ChpT